MRKLVLMTLILSANYVVASAEEESENTSALNTEIGMLKKSYAEVAGVKQELDDWLAELRKPAATVKTHYETKEEGGDEVADFEMQHASNGDVLYNSSFSSEGMGVLGVELPLESTSEDRYLKCSIAFYWRDGISRKHGWKGTGTCEGRVPLDFLEQRLRAAKKDK